MVGRGGRLAQRVFEQGGRIALARFDRRDGRQRGSSTRPSWKRGGKGACFYVHAPKLEARRQGGLLLRPRARAGNAAARWPASTSTRPGWKRGGKVACFYVHASGLETRRQGGLLLRPRAQAGNAAVQGGLLLRPRAQARSAAVRWPASASTRPSWKRGGAVAWVVEKRSRAQPDLLAEERPATTPLGGGGQASKPGFQGGEAGRGAEPGGATWRVAPRASPPEGFGLGRSRGWSGEQSKRKICRLSLVACSCPTAPAAQSAASTAERSPARPPSATRGSSDPTVPSAV